MLHRPDRRRADDVGLRLDRAWRGRSTPTAWRCTTGSSPASSRLSRPGGRGDRRGGLRHADALLLARLHQPRSRRPQAGRRPRGRADRRRAAAGRAADRLPGALRPALPRGRARGRGWSGSSTASARCCPWRASTTSSSGLENHYKDGFWKYPEFAQKMDVFLELLAAIPDRDHFGVQYDPSNAIVAGDDPIALLRGRGGSGRQHARQRPLPGRGDDARRPPPDRRHARAIRPTSGTA